jgi:hypothetical protein
LLPGNNCLQHRQDVAYRQQPLRLGLPGKLGCGGDGNAPETASRDWPSFPTTCRGTVSADSARMPALPILWKPGLRIVALQPARDHLESPNAGRRPPTRLLFTLGGITLASEDQTSGQRPYRRQSLHPQFFRRVRSRAPRASALKSPQHSLPPESRGRTRKPVAQTNPSRAELP